MKRYLRSAAAAPVHLGPLPQVANPCVACVRPARDLLDGAHEMKPHMHTHALHSACRKVVRPCRELSLVLGGWSWRTHTKQA
eukprot:8020343-Karenia_brevis.AAC.2